MIVPYRADVAIYRQPVANIVIIGLTVLFYILTINEAFSDEFLSALILYDWGISGMVGYILLHAGPFHLAGNMIFLWVFGNAICAKVGNLAYVLIYLGLGVFSAMVHLVFDGMPAVGASGAINGIVGMFLATPIMAVLRIVLGRFDGTKPVAELLAGRLPKSSQQAA